MRAAQTAPSEVRSARSDDAEGVVALWVDLVDHHRRLDADYPQLGELRSALRAEVRRAMRKRACKLLVGEQDGEIVGFLFAEVNAAALQPSAPTQAWIHELYVAVDCRRRGLGRALVARALEFFEEQQGGRVAVRVESGNAAGLAFWERVGFEERARIFEAAPRALLAGRAPRR